MAITVTGPTPPSVPDRLDVPGTPPKIVPGATSAQDPTWPSSDSDASAGQTGTRGGIGETGGNNVDGGETPSHLNFIVEGFTGVLTVTVTGGNGGVGGRGGTGGNGGKGKMAARGTMTARTAPVARAAMEARVEPAATAAMAAPLTASTCIFLMPRMQ